MEERVVADSHLDSGVFNALFDPPNGVHLTHFETCLAELQSYYQSLSPADVVWSEELLKHRRQEASHE